MPKAFRCRRSREEHKESRYPQGEHREGPSSGNMELFSQVCWRKGEDHREASKAGCCEAATGSKEATLARSWARPSPAARHSRVMLKEQCCNDGSQDGSFSPGREELPPSHTSLILVTASLHQLLFKHVCIMLPDTCHSTHVTQGFLPVTLSTGAEKLSCYCGLATWAIGWREKTPWASKLKEVCHFCSSSLTYISFAASALQHLRGVICVNIWKGTFFFNADTLLRWLLDYKLWKWLR